MEGVQEVLVGPRGEEEASERDRVASRLLIQDGRPGPELDQYIYPSIYPSRW